MKAFLLILATFFSFSSFACMISLEAVNDKVKSELVESLKLDPSLVSGQKLLQSRELWPQTRTSSCPDVMIFYHSFRVKKDRECTILTKYRMGIGREEINPFVVLDNDCD